MAVTQPTHSTLWSRRSPASASPDRARIGRAWAVLMRRLGYERYGVHGNDAGSLISPEVGRADPDHVVGVHVTQLFSFPSGDPAELANLTPEELKRVEFLQSFNDNMTGFSKIQTTRPQTLAYALADSPVGELAWNAELFGMWTSPRPAGDPVDNDYILTNVSIYWFTNTGGSSARLYYEDA